MRRVAWRSLVVVWALTLALFVGAWVQSHVAPRQDGLVWGHQLQGIALNWHKHLAITVISADGMGRLKRRSETGDYHYREPNAVETSGWGRYDAHYDGSPDGWSANNGRTPSVYWPSAGWRRFLPVQVDSYFQRIDGGRPGSPTMEFRTDELTFRYGFFVALLLLPLAPRAAALIRRRRAQFLRGAQRCERCGYDLRATPDRCPECGAVPTERAGAAA